MAGTRCSTYNRVAIVLRGRAPGGDASALRLTGSGVAYSCTVTRAVTREAVRGEEGLVARPSANAYHHVLQSPFLAQRDRRASMLQAGTPCVQGVRPGRISLSFPGASTGLLFRVA